MKWTFKNIIKAIIFYMTGCLLAWTIGVVLEDDISWNFKCVWCTGVMLFVVVTFFMCKGKSVKEFKEFTGIDLDH